MATAATASATRAGRRSPIIQRVVMVLTGLFFALWTLVPMYWIIATSLKTDLAVFREVSLIPTQPTLGNYQKILTQTNFLLYIRNSMEVAIVTTALSMIFGSAAAYAIARLQFRGRGTVARSIVVSYLVPGSLLFISL